MIDGMSEVLARRKVNLDVVNTGGLWEICMNQGRQRGTHFLPQHRAVVTAVHLKQESQAAPGRVGTKLFRCVFISLKVNERSPYSHQIRW
jgi:hypothetical protein